MPTRCALEAFARVERERRSVTFRATFARDERRLVFEAPLEIVAPYRAHELRAAFARVDEALTSGYAVAGYLTYECGTALAGIAAPRDTDLPLFAIGIYESSSTRDLDRPNADDAPPFLRDNERSIATKRFPMPIALNSRNTYDRALETIARRLIDGDVYQVNFTVPFAFSTTCEPRELFDSLVARAAVAHGALIEHDDRAYVSLSPELFLRFEADEIVTKPMKGTARLEARGELESEKNRAEHLMIVDLLRNDLHRICDDVRVERLFETERYPTFATMTSTIRGRLRANLGLHEIFEATYPCGSVTGAPKRAAMQTIAELEGAPRGIAMGSIGYLLPDRRGVWNVAIRTIALDRATGRADVRIGGGIVADSDATTEWAEIFIKRRLFETVAEPISLFETLRVGTSAEVRAQHVCRMCDSAERLGIPVLHETIENAILLAARAPEAESFVNAEAVEVAQLVRVELHADGTLTQSHRPLETPTLPIRICHAPTILDSNDPLLRHKTTRREAYDAATAFARERDCFEGVLRNERGSLADCARSTLFVRDRDGVLATPPLGDGALAGVLRAQLLARNRAVERTLTANDLAHGELFIGNSARGLLPALLMEIS